MRVCRRKYAFYENKNTKIITVRIVFTICANNFTFQFLDVLLKRFVMSVISAYKLIPKGKGKV